MQSISSGKPESSIAPEQNSVIPEKPKRMDFLNRETIIPAPAHTVQAIVN